MSDHDEGITLPHSIEAEMAVLACLLNDPEKKNLLRVVDSLQPEDFYKSAHRLIYGTVVELHKNREQVPGDLVAVSNELRKNNQLESVGGRVYLTDIYCSHSVDANLEYYAREVRRFSLRRRMFSHSKDVAQETLKEEAVEDTMAKASTNWLELQQFAAFDKKSSVLESILNVYDLIEYRKDHPGIHGIPSGYPELDELTTGFHGKHLTVLAGRPGMGKTQFALNLTYNACTLIRQPGEKRKRVCWFSYEMPTDQLIERLYSLISEVPGQSLRTGVFDYHEDWPKLGTAMKVLTEMSLDIFDTSSIPKKVSAIAAQARRMEADGELPDMFVVDHIGFLRPEKEHQGKGPSNRQQEVKEIMEDLHELAMEIDRPFILLCQLSRELEKRQNKRPILSDLRESGDIEQTADNVIFIHRDDYYNKEAENKGVTELIVAKQRSGPDGTVQVLFRSSIGKFYHLPRDEWSKAAPKAAQEPKGPKYPGKVAADAPMDYSANNN